MPTLFCQILSDGAIQTSYDRTSKVCLSTVEWHLCLLFKGLLTRVGEMALAGEEGVVSGGQLSPK